MGCRVAVGGLWGREVWLGGRRLAWPVGVGGGGLALDRRLGSGAAVGLVVVAEGHLHHVLADKATFSRH